MKEIEVDGKKYVDKESYDEKVSKEPILNVKTVLNDPCNIYGLGTIGLQGSYIHTRVSLEYLKKAIGMIEALDIDCMDIVFANDKPMLIGALDKENRNITGVIIAPRISND